MRLIDADEVLKRWGLKFYAMGGDRLGPNGEEISFYVNGLLNEIQNAPTVDTYTEDDVKTAIKEGHEVGYEMAKAKFERPQGEWLTNRVAFHLTCPFCGCNLRALKDKVFEGDYEYNFCPNCGADMRGGRE